MKIAGVPVTPTDLPNASEAWILALVSGLAAQGGDLIGIGAGLGCNRLQLFVRIGLGDTFLLLEGFRDELPNCAIRCATDTIHIVSSLFGPVVIGKWKILEDEMSVRLLRQELLNRGRDLFAVRTLHIAEFDNHHGRFSRTLGRSVHALFELDAIPAQMASRRRG